MLSEYIVDVKNRMLSLKEHEQLAFIELVKGPAGSELKKILGKERAMLDNAPKKKRGLAARK